MTDQPRVVAGRYTIIRELGRGGMGVVWLAEDKTIGRRVAIKELLLPQGIAPDERHVFEERVLREARTAGRLSDPGIVTVHDVFQQDGGTFIVMELIEAPNLSDVIRQQGAQPVEQVLKIAEQLLSALETAHKAGVVHRDVKPSNVMFGENGRVKLTDFGIAQTTEDTRLTSSGMLMGSPTYISPERLLGKDAEAASDLWALGATLFFAAEGYGAYDRSTTAAAIQAIMNERPQVRQVHGPLADLIMGLLDSNPETRLNAGQAKYLIEQARQRVATKHLVQPQPIPHPVLPQAQPGSTRAMATPPVGKSRRPLVLSAAVVVLLAVVATVLALTGAFSGSKPTNTAASPTTSQANQPTDQSTASTPTSESETSTTDDATASVKPKNVAPAQTYGPGGELTAKDLVDYGGAGYCYNGKGFEETVDDCKKAHDVEVFDHRSLEDLDAYPGKEKLVKLADEACAEKFGLLTMKDKENALKIWSLVPTRGAWDDGKRKALCVAAKVDGGKLTGTVTGS